MIIENTIKDVSSILHVINDSAVKYKEVIPAWGVPALNTAILLASGITVTLAHWALTLHARGLPALPLVCMFVYFSVVVYHREFLWYTILQTYLFFMHTMFLVYT